MSSTNGANKPTKLHISTQAVNRLLKEKEYYLKEVDGEKAKVKRLRAELREKVAGGVEPEENEEYLIDQRVCLSSRALSLNAFSLPHLKPGHVPHTSSPGSKLGRSEF